MRVRWYAGAAEAAGVEEETVSAPEAGVSLQEALARHRPGAAGVLQRCTFLVDGARLPGDEPWPAEAETIDVLPPFVGG